MNIKLNILFFSIIQSHCIIAFSQTSKIELTYDSLPIVFAKCNFPDFDLIKFNTPGLPFDRGIFLPNENIWYFKFTDTSIKLKTFSISHYDSSVYLAVVKANALYLYNFKHDKKRELLKLEKDENVTVSPIGALDFYLLVKDSISSVFICNSTSQQKILTSRIGISKLLAVDSRTFIVSYRHLLVMHKWKDKRAKILVKSKLPIISFCFLDSGAPVISNIDGIFLIDKKLNARKIDLNVSDGILKRIGKYVYVLSNRNRKIYKIGMFAAG